MSIISINFLTKHDPSKRNTRRNYMDLSGILTSSECQIPL